jgi:tetratricopeptide (TPR) repeat protein
MTWPSSRTLVIVGVAVVAVALAALGGWAWWDAQQRRALEASAQVLARVQPAFGPDATADVKASAAKELEQLLERYPSARSAPTVAYELGNIRLSAGQYPAARAAYELVLRQGATGVVATMSQAGVARSWESERDFGRAADAYAAMVKSLGLRSFLYEDALMDQARVLELGGKKAEAVAIYERILKEIPTAKRTADIRTRLASLGTASR